MAEAIAEKFVEALGKLEAERDVETIVSLFGDDCEVGNIIAPEKFHGAEGARKFWTTYRETFGEVSSSFRNRIASEKNAALEWKTEGTNSRGQQISYEGVSILEMANGKIKRFYAYFDPSLLGEQMKEQPPAENEAA